MRSFLKVIVMSFLSLVIIGTTFVSGFSMGQWEALTTPSTSPTATIAPAEESADFDLFWEAWGIIEEEFYGELPTETETTYGAIKGALNKLEDDYTAFVEPKYSELFKENMSGSFEGIGALVRQDEAGRLIIAEPFEGQPAAKAGLQKGDVVLEVDGTPLQGLNTTEAVMLIRGPRGTVVTLLILRKEVAEPFEVEVTRDKIEIPIITQEMLDEDIAYLELTDFNNVSPQKTRRALKELLKQKPRGLILDLRSNPGGYLHAAIEIASEFVGEGTIVIERHSDGTEKTFTAVPGGVATEIPLVVLVNGGSASASEIVAGAIQDQERGILVGEQTFGKGSVQSVHDLSDGSTLRVTVARWFTPNNQQIQDQGLEPDIEIELTEEDYEEGRDPQLDRAVEYLLNGE